MYAFPGGVVEDQDEATRWDHLKAGSFTNDFKF